MALLTLDQAKAHLRIPLEMTAEDGDLTLKLAQAEAIVRQRCASTAYWRPIVAAWTDVTVPLAVQASVLLVLTNLHEHRGDDMTLDAKVFEAVDRLLGLNKDPVLA